MKLRKHKNLESPDLRWSYEDKAEVRGGMLYRRANLVQVWWDHSGRETWMEDDEASARRLFVDKRTMFRA